MDVVDLVLSGEGLSLLTVTVEADKCEMDVFRSQGRARYDRPVEIPPHVETVDLRVRYAGEVVARACVFRRPLTP